MRFSEYLKSKTNLLVIWFLFHGIALFVNVFNIKGDVSSETKYIEDRTSKRVFNDIYLLTVDKSMRPYNEKKSEAFWPFVNFYSNKLKGPDYSRNGYEGDKADYYITRFVEFNGIFFQYDYSEFLAYSVLLFLVLYLKWNSRYTSTKSKKNL